MKLFVLICFLMSFVQARAESLPALIKVSSFSEKNIEPNMMNIQIYIWAKANTSVEAQDAAAKLHKKFKDLTEKFKIKKDDVQTQGFSVNPEYAYEAKTGISKIQGYNANHSISIVFRNIEQVGAFLDQVATGDKKEKSGITVQNTVWDSDKKGAAETDCITAAVQSARSRAEDLAKASDVKIKGVYSIANQQVFSNYEESSLEGSGRSPKAMMMSDGVSKPQTQLNPGKIRIRADVSVEYYIQN